MSWLEFTGDPRQPAHEGKTNKQPSTGRLGHAFRNTCAIFRRRIIGNCQSCFEMSKIYVNLWWNSSLPIASERRWIVRCKHRRVDHKVHCDDRDSERQKLTQYTVTSTTGVPGVVVKYMEISTKTVKLFQRVNSGEKCDATTCRFVLWSARLCAFCAPIVEKTCGGSTKCGVTIMYVTFFGD